MIPSKGYYMMVGADLTFALICAVMHDPRTFLFLGLAFLTKWVGDRVHEIEAAKEKGDQNG